MNWLAHLRLSPPQPLLRLGNLAGDFVAGVELSTLHPDLQRGIALHRAIDRFVDAHPVVVAAKARLVPPHRRFAGVLLDVWFDHFLARDWAQHGDGRALPQFLAGVHGDLRAHSELLPAPLQRVAPRFCADGWLEGYASVDGIARVLGLMARQLSRPTPLASGAELLRADYASVERDFAALWPELVAFAAASAPARAERCAVVPTAVLSYDAAMARTAVTIYSDGACLGNPGRGGYGTVLLFGEHRKELSAGFQRTTNNRMELLGAIVGLEALKRPCDVTLWSDSQYVIHAMTKGWLDGWQKKGWRTSSKEPVKNRDLWERLLRALGEHEITWQWVRGHTGDVENERCDQLAVAAANGPDLAVDAGFDG